MERTCYLLCPLFTSCRLTLAQHLVNGTDLGRISGQASRFGSRLAHGALSRVQARGWLKGYPLDPGLLTFIRYITVVLKHPDHGSGPHYAVHYVLICTACKLCIKCLMVAPRHSSHGSGPPPLHSL